MNVINSVPINNFAILSGRKVTESKAVSNINTIDFEFKQIHE